MPPEFITFHIWVMIPWLSVTSTPFPKQNRGALSKNRTCDSSLPRTCFTTRLLGRFVKSRANYTDIQKKIKQKPPCPIFYIILHFFNSVLCSGNTRYDSVAFWMARLCVHVSSTVFLKYGKICVHFFAHAVAKYHARIIFT